MGRQYREGYTRCLENKRVVEITREVSGSVRVVGKNPNSVWWNDGVKPAVERKEAAWKEALGAEDEVTKKKVNGNLKRRKEKGLYISEQKVGK